MVDRDEFLQALAIVEASPNIRLLHRLVPRDRYGVAKGDATAYTGAIIDLEATSAEPSTAEVIEIGVVRFSFGADGTVFDVEDRYSALQQPSAPIDPIITEITGITDADVEGQSISLPRLAEVTAGVDLMIAYHADYDRRLAERTWPGLFESKKWACAYRQVPWAQYGVIGGKLHHVVTAAGLFFDAHRAVADCDATLHVLATMSRELPGFPDFLEGLDGAAAAEVEAGVWVERVTPMRELLETTKGGAVRVLAHNSPIEDKDRLKARGYQWRGRVPWYLDLNSDGAAKVEAEWLRANIRGCRPGFLRISARDRFSVREERMTWPDAFVDYGNPYT